VPTTTAARERLAIALDTGDLDRAIAIATAVQPHVAIAKVGLELFSAAGRDAVAALRDLGMTVFLDVKLHDIPNTVARAATVLGALGARFLTLHASGGEAMLRAGVQGLGEGAAGAGLAAPAALAVTVLTSDADAPPDVLHARVTAAVSAGCAGVICAAADLDQVKRDAPRLLAVTPGIRPSGVPSHDQGRPATPADAIAKGADILVLGRAVTAADDPADAATAIAQEVEEALRGAGSPAASPPSGRN